MDKPPEKIIHLPHHQEEFIVSTITYFILIEGTGIVKVSSQEYKLLKQFKQNKDKAMQTINILVAKEIISSDRADLIKKISQNFGSIS
ncbi:MAG: hypothetical protein F6J96_33410 [Symploca sp. SIO1C2]|nr:hypothetical protein [Symploca sp. SIO1C2]